MAELLHEKSSTDEEQQELCQPRERAICGKVYPSPDRHDGITYNRLARCGKKCLAIGLAGVDAVALGRGMKVAASAA